MDIIGLGIQLVLLVASLVAAGYLALAFLVVGMIRAGDGTGSARSDPEYWPLTIQLVLAGVATVVLLIVALCILWDWLARAAGGPTPW